MILWARAKINWTLNVTGRRQDGYHLLDMLMQPLSLHDTLTIEEAKDVTLKISGGGQLEAGESNLIVRAARALQKETGLGRGAAMRLEKRIPMGAGLGGGSADAAAALKGLNELWGCGLSFDQLCAIGLRLGADIPFCLHDAPRRAQGVGEILSPIASREYPLVLLQPCEALSTREVFSAYHSGDYPPADTENALLALAAGDLAALRKFGGNVLESASVPLRPQIAEAKEKLYQCGAAFAQMTGSGSVVFGAFSSAEAADRAYETLRGQYPVCLRTETAL